MASKLRLVPPDDSLDRLSNEDAERFANDVAQANKLAGELLDRLVADVMAQAGSAHPHLVLYSLWSYLARSLMIAGWDGRLLVAQAQCLVRSADEPRGHA